MANSSELNSIEGNLTDASSNVSANVKPFAPDVHPLAFTIEFNDQKIDEARKSKVHERLSAFTLKHKRNPSLPDFGAVQNANGNTPIEKLPSPLNSQHVPIIGKTNQKFGNNSDIQWKSSPLKAIKNGDLKSPAILRNLEVNNIKENFLKHFKNGRRNSLNDIDSNKMSHQTGEISITQKFHVIKNGGDDRIHVVKNGGEDRMADLDNKSDTVSEAGTYTVDKEDESPENEGDKTQIIVDQDEMKENLNETKSSFRSSWINDWVRDVEEQNMRNPALKEPSIALRSSGSGHGSPGASKIPSPINTLSRKVKLRNNGPTETFPNKINGYMIHKRSSSLSAKVRQIHFYFFFPHSSLANTFLNINSKSIS